MAAGGKDDRFSDR